MATAKPVLLYIWTLDFCIYKIQGIDTICALNSTVLFMTEHPLADLVVMIT